MSPRKNVTYSSHPNHAARLAHAKGEKLFRTYDTSYIRPKRRIGPAIACLIILAVAIVVIVAVVVFSLKGCSSASLVADGTAVQIVIEDGEGANSVANTLVEKGLISHASDFTDRLRQLDEENSLHPGTYTILGGTSLDDIIETLQTPVASETFTVPEGSSISQTATIIETATDGRISADEFNKAASDASVYASSFSFLAEVGTNSLEGFLFPKTYPISEESTADSLIRTMLAQFEQETASLDYSYAQSKGLSFYDVVKLASIVEKEDSGSYTSQIASVFYNRLAAGMKLQSDATTAYYVGHDPTAEDIATETPYNTYFIDGLTPTPINSPGLNSLKAVCSPAETSYYYFYFDESGNTTFSETYEEHRATYE